jgi:regulator of protease activity HflC (stomatin/prohibitin superfamily)
MNDLSGMIQFSLAVGIGLAAIVIIVRSFRIVPQATASIVERLGRYHRTLQPGLNFIVPFIDRVFVGVDMRERVVSFPPQPVITQDNLVVSIDTVVFFQVTEPKSATYEIQDFVRGIEQLTVTTLRNLVGGLDLEQALTSRDSINAQLRGVLDEATGKWGVRVNRVELKAIDPPPSVQDSMEKQMRAEREKRAAILTAEGEKQSQILTAEGARQAEILKAEGDAKAAVLRANGEAEAVGTIFGAVHAGKIDSDILAYLYMQQLPQIANGTANKVWVLPAELSGAIEKISAAFRPPAK